MKVMVWIIWGEEPEDGAEPDGYAFATEGEADAFLRGVDESQGWMDYTQVPSADYRWDAEKDEAVEKA